MRDLKLVTVALFVVACTPPATRWPEPAWGSAPAPRPEEVTEITYEHRHCARDKCTTESVVLRRDGQAFRRTEEGRSTPRSQYGTIDSVSFVGVVHEFNTSRFFGLGSFDADGAHVPMVEDSWLISGATYCRRSISSFMRRPDMSNGPFRIVPVLDSVIRTIEWKEATID